MFVYQIYVSTEEINDKKCVNNKWLQSYFSK